MLDLDALRAAGQFEVPLCASNLYLVGQAVLTLNNDQLTVNLSFSASANVDVSACSVYVIGNACEFTESDPAAMAQPAYTPGQGIDVTGLSSALLYVPMEKRLWSSARRMTRRKGKRFYRRWMPFWREGAQHSASS